MRFLKINYENKKKSMAILLIFFFVISTISTLFLFFHVGVGVSIKFEQAYYDVNGNPVNSIWLGPGEAKILFRTSDKTDGKEYGERIRPGKSIRFGCYFYGGFNESSVEFITNNFDVVSLAGGMNSNDLNSARIINPNLRFYRMTLGAWWNGPLNETTENWVLRLNNGEPADVVRANPPESYEMDFGNKEFAQWFAEYQIKRCKEFGADGVAVDEIMWDGYWGMDKAKYYGNDPEDYRDYKNIQEIRESCYQFIQRIHNIMEPSGVELITQAFWPEAQQYQDGVWGETSFKACPNGKTMDKPNHIWKNICHLTWEGIVQNIIDAGNKSYIWACWYDWENMKQLEYGISTYLMAKRNGQFNVGFQPFGYKDRNGWPSNINGWNASVVQLAIENHPEYFNIEMGDALGEMQRINSIEGYYWKRDFDNGIVIINPHAPSILGFRSEPNYSCTS